MSRREALENIVIKSEEDRVKMSHLIDEILFLEEQMEECRQYPQRKIDPKDPVKQKATVAAKQYKEYLQQYRDSLRLLIWMSGGVEEAEEESPLRIWAKSREGIRI